MPSRWILAGLLAVAAGVGLALYMNQGSHLRLDGSILKTRVIATDTNACVVIIELRATNPSNVKFVTSEATLTIVDKQNAELTGDTVAQGDLDRVLDYYKEAGPRYNPVLMIRSVIEPKQTVDRTVAASFPLPEQTVNQRKALVLRIREIDGTVVELRSSREK